VYFAEKVFVSNGSFREVHIEDSWLFILGNEKRFTQ
jgi:hypothetical protein